MGFIEIFTSGSYDRDLKILKILASNSKWVRVYGIFKKWQIDDDKGGENQIRQVFRWLLLKITSGLKNSPEYDF